MNLNGEGGQGASTDDGEKIFVPSFPFNGGPDWGLLGKFEPATWTMAAGFQLTAQFPALPVDIVFQKDVAVTLRDGVTIYADILRPTGSEKVPVIMAWSPYGKSAGSTAPKRSALYGMLGLDARISGLEKFEGPDAAYWCQHGYAICNPDARGIADCEGDSNLLGRQEGQDACDVIEWVAAQDWCTGKVAMSGTSYLAASQWFAAAEQPPHLAAINPTEGFSDVYRDLLMRGGMPDFGFTDRLQSNFAGKGQREDLIGEAKRYPLMNKLWQDKVARFDQITVPAYIIASYSNTLHTRGTFRAWRRMASKEKWLRIHNTQEWPDYYDESTKEDLRKFYDYFLKGEANGWDETPRVRYSLLDMRGGDRINQSATEFPPTDVSYEKFYLHGDSRIMTPNTPPTKVAVAAYLVDMGGMASFKLAFAEKTTLIGYPKARLFVEARGSDDMDLFFLVQKLDAYGSPLQQFTVPNHGAIMHDITENGSSILRYKGSYGRLRVSLRKLDEKLSTDIVPEHTFDQEEKLAPGEIAEIEIDLSPVGLVFYPGESIRFIVSSNNILGAMMPFTPDVVPANRGQHVIHTGGSNASYLQLPVQAR
ncbi:MAG: hypothetical protein TREMPRED_002761 [Tremellales sp. Tagirdzhanova-0007]|nr:MAG: hypothetical protein TREMPRED_002761 [Tremellales sp. Tagirdzhanova-0007]